MGKTMNMRVSCSLLGMVLLALGLSDMAGCSTNAGTNPAGDQDQALNQSPGGNQTAAQIMVPQFHQGQRYAKKVRLTSNLRMLIPNADYQESEMLLEYEVLDVDPEGTATIEITIASFKAAMRSLTIICRYDSEPKADSAAAQSATASDPSATAATSDRQKQYESVCGGLKSCRYKAKVNARGRVLSLFDLDKKIQDYMSGPITSGYIGGYQLAFLLSETNLRDYACCWFYGDMPIRAPKAQAKWQAVTPAETPQTAPVLAQKDFVLTGVSSADQQDWAEIAVKIAGPSKGTIPTYVANNLKRRQPDMEIVNLYGEGQAKLTLHDGQVRYWHEKITAEVRLAGEKYRQLESQSSERRRNRSFYVMEKTIEWVKP